MYNDKNNNVQSLFTDEERKKLEEEEKYYKENYKGIKLISFVFPLLGFLGAIMHIKDKELFETFKVWSWAGTIIYIIIAICIIT